MINQEKNLPTKSHDLFRNTTFEEQDMAALRALFIVLNIYSKENISKAEIPTGKPYFIEFKNNNILNNYYL